MIKVFNCQIEGNPVYFVFEKNAKAESKDIKTVEVSQEDFDKGIKEGNFLDAEEYLKKSNSNGQGKKQDAKTTAKTAKPKPTKASEPKANEIGELKKVILELEKRVAKTEEENKVLKSKSEKKTLSFEEAEKVYQQKA